MIWEARLRGELSIPESCVMCADIPDIKERHHPIVQSRIRDSVLVGNAFSQVIVNTLEKVSQRACRHQFGHHPKRKLRMMIGILEVPAKFFFASGCLKLQRESPVQIAFVAEFWKVLLMTIPERSELRRELMRQLRSQGNLKTFNGIENQHSQASIKTVPVPDDFQ